LIGNQHVDDQLLRPHARLPGVDRDYVDPAHCGQTFCFDVHVTLVARPPCIAPQSMAHDDQATVDDGAKDREFSPFRKITAEHGLSLRFVCSSVVVDKQIGSVFDPWSPRNQGIAEHASDFVSRCSDARINHTTKRSAIWLDGLSNACPPLIAETQ